ncbi:hypothetical protein E2562_001517 [Oryza meyeriana var. granulata]|uniref:Uncharacterized protein n=1 Tax=Oryza meyeriana var. granulata TaxID=110450 RepID=A0A6G1DCX2_9ORYZ|nr:hypothetical protein E2562_001517 [Oryza meyeriana var. granulata]
MVPAEKTWKEKRIERERTTDMKDRQDTPNNMDVNMGFSSADPVEEVDIGDGSVLRPTFINANMPADQKSKIAKTAAFNLSCVWVS